MADHSLRIFRSSVLYLLPRLAGTSFVVLEARVRRAAWKMRCQFPNDKFLKDPGDAAFRNTEQRVLHQQSRTAIACRIVKIGDTAACKAPENRRVMRLPALIVALANHSSEIGRASCRERVSLS